MRLVLVGADLEENLGLGMIAAAVEASGHEARIVPFDDDDDAGDTIERVLCAEPDAVGLSVQFQHRAQGFVNLARRLRAAGFAGHLTAGGQWPTMAWDALLAGGHGFDSVVLHEGERTVVELLDALSTGSHLGDVPGLALRSDDGVPMRSAPRPLEKDLDRYPFPMRYRPHSRHLGIPFVPIMGSRGCWGSCSYCSITTFYRDARRRCPDAPPLRLRSPRDVASEMALLWFRAGGPTLFCFHDDNFLLKRPEDSLRRVREIRGHLDDLGVGKIGIIGKARPETLTPALARELARLGVIRLYLGIENASVEGAAHLRRRRQVKHIEAALDACRRAGIFVCYNLLIFEPEATLAQLRENAAFMASHPQHPVNFCRAEPYHGTPLWKKVSRTQELGGSVLGWNYRIADDEAELAFRICSSAFRERNFGAAGVANRSMGVGYSIKIAEHFYEPGTDRVFRSIRQRADELTADLVRETAGFLERALDLAEGGASQDADRVERGTALLGLAIAAADERWHERMDELHADLEAWARARRRPEERPRPGAALRGLAKQLTLGLSLTLGAATWSCSHAVDPAPRDAGADADDAMAPDPAPQDAGLDADADPDEEVDLPADPPPRDDPRAALDPAGGGAGPLIDRWRDTETRRAPRSADLPLHEPPDVRLTSVESHGAYRVTLVGGSDPLSTRWEAAGEINGEGREVRWTPASAGDLLRVAVRSPGGISVLELRARSVIPRS